MARITSDSPAPSQAAAAPSDPTFRRYTATQAARYQAHRIGYPKALIDTIVTHHTATGGQLGTLLDVGCGPGLATRAVAPHFTRAFGVDPSVEMINAARAASSSFPEGDPSPIHFAISTAESLPGSELSAGTGAGTAHDDDDYLPPGSVDLLTAATAAHWFDMARFWPRAAALVRPGGTVAIWTSVHLYCHPHSTPNATEVQRVLDRLETERLAAFRTRGNEISNSQYRELGMPWEGAGAGGLRDGGFPRDEFVRKEWNVGGEVREGATFFCGQAVVPLEQFAAACGTASMVTRWREAHPDLAGTDQDVVHVTVRELREALGGRAWFEGGEATVLLLFKRRGGAGVDGTKMAVTTGAGARRAEITTGGWPDGKTDNR